MTFRISAPGRYTARNGDSYLVVAVLAEHDCAVGVWVPVPGAIDPDQAMTWSLGGSQLGVGDCQAGDLVAEAE